MSFKSIPILDLSQANDPATKPAFLAELRHALMEVGFLYLKNVGIPDDEFERVIELGKAFFDIPEEEKYASLFYPVYLCLCLCLCLQVFFCFYFFNVVPAPWVASFSVFIPFFFFLFFFSLPVVFDAVVVFVFASPDSLYSYLISIVYGFTAEQGGCQPNHWLTHSFIKLIGPPIVTSVHPNKLTLHCQ